MQTKHDTVFLDVEQWAIGVRDKCIAYPTIGNKRTLNLNKQEIRIYDTDKYAYDISKGMGLPNLNRYKFEYLIYLAEKNGTTFYEIKSLCQNPFRINGVYSYHSLLSHNDTVYIGYNKLVFMKKEVFQKAPHKLHIKNFDKISNSPLCVFLEGETGTGKSYLAKKIHENSNRKGEFVHLNLSSFSKDLIESELFGHKKGSFTGAFFDKKGGFLQAHGGTLLLDEIDSLNINIQTKLLLFLDNHYVRPVGGLKETKVDTKIIIASGRSLLDIVRKGLFRKDLYFRITAGHKIRLQPLRKDREKIKEILSHFSQKNNICISCDLRFFYEQYDWPGNLRQLYSHLELKKNMSLGTRWIQDDHDLELQQNYQESHKDIEDGVIPLKQLKKDYVNSVFYKTRHSFNETAKLLQITPTTVKNILNKC